jgi:hypothetical protein
MKTTFGRRCRGSEPAGLWQQGWQLRIHRVAPPKLFCLWRAQRAIGSLAKQIQLLRLQFAQIARFLVEYQRTIANATNLLNEVADLLKHLAQFAVAPFDQDHLVPRIVSLPHLANARRRGLYLA